MLKHIYELKLPANTHQKKGCVFLTLTKNKQTKIIEYRI